MIDSSFAGALIKNGHKTTERKSIIICGPTRGGTSFAASVFYRLGVPFTRDPDDELSNRLEHSDLKRAFSARDWRTLETTVEDFCYLHSVWGWKLPAIESQLARVVQMVPNPHAVMIFKEPLSVATRKAIVRKKDLMQLLQRVVGTHTRMAALAASIEDPLLLISYDKAIANLPAFLRIAANYAGVTSYNEDTVIAGIQEDQRRYFEANADATA